MNFTKKDSNKNDLMWEREYQNPQFLSLGNQPQKDFKDFISFLKKKLHIELEGKALLDVGCGVGRNALYVAKKYGMKGGGFDVSPHAIELAQERKKELEEDGYEIGNKVKFFTSGIKALEEILDNTYDIIIDVTVSPSLSQSEFDYFLFHTKRILKPGGFFFSRVLLLDSDRHAKYLIQNNPGTDKNSYIHPETKVHERMVLFNEYKKELSLMFKVVHSEKNYGYQRWGKEGNTQSVKRFYGLYYCKKLEKIIE